LATQFHGSSIHAWRTPPLFAVPQRLPPRSSNRISAVPSARFIRDVSAMCGHSASGVPLTSTVHSRSIRFSLAHGEGNG